LLTKARKHLSDPGRQSQIVFRSHHRRKVKVARAIVQVINTRATFIPHLLLTAWGKKTVSELLFRPHAVPAIS
jgi:hypothetical protein